MKTTVINHLGGKVKKVQGMSVSPQLSPKAMRVLTLIAEGRSYAQIVDSGEDITYPDIFAAAEEALSLLEGSSTKEYERRMAAIKKVHPRAYERWTDDEDSELLDLHRRGHSIGAISEHFGRQPSAISSRLRRLLPLQLASGD